MILSDVRVKFILALLDRNQDMYLDEIAEQLMDQRNVSVSLSTVQRMLKLLSITTKKVCVCMISYTVYLWFYSYRMSPLNDAKVSVKRSCVKLHRSLLGIWCSPMRPP